MRTTLKEIANKAIEIYEDSLEDFRATNGDEDAEGRMSVTSEILSLIIGVCPGDSDRDSVHGLIDALPEPVDRVAARKLIDTLTNAAQREGIAALAAKLRCPTKPGYRNTPGGTFEVRHIAESQVFRFLAGCPASDWLPITPAFFDDPEGG